MRVCLLVIRSRLGHRLPASLLHHPAHAAAAMAMVGVSRLSPRGFSHSGFGVGHSHHLVTPAG